MAALAGDLDAALEAYELAADLVPERVAADREPGHRPASPRSLAGGRRGVRPGPAHGSGRRGGPARPGARPRRSVASDRAPRPTTSGWRSSSTSLGRSADAAEAARRAAELEPSSARDALAARLTAAASRRHGPDARGTAASSRASPSRRRPDGRDVGEAAPSPRRFRARSRTGRRGGGGRGAACPAAGEERGRSRARGSDRRARHAARSGST